MRALPLATAVRVLIALDVAIDLRLVSPFAAERPQRDRAHVRCVAYVARRLTRSGYDVATEAQLGNGRWLGFADLLAFDPDTRWLLLIEVKTVIDDVGAIDRQIGGYEGGAWTAAHRHGWRPRAVIGILLVLATEESDRRLSSSRDHFDRRHRIRARALGDLIDRRGVHHPARGERGLAMIDPASRRRAWLLPTWLDGRRVPAPYRDRVDYLTASFRSGSRKRTAPHGIIEP